MASVKNQQGFSLLELIVYIAIIAIFLISVVQFTTSVIQAGEKAKILTEVQQNARFAMQRVRREARTADGIDGSSTLGVTLSSLVLEDDVGGDDPTTFDVSSGTLRITEGAGSAVDLTSSKVTVSEFLVEDRSISGRTTNLKITMTLSWAGSTNTAFDTTVTLRSSVVIREEQD